MVIFFFFPLDCVFFRNDIIFMVYVDDGIFLGNDDSKLQDAIKEIQDSGLNIEDQGHPADYIGVNIKKLRDGSYEFSQRTLIDASSLTSDIRMQKSSLSLRRYPSCYTHLRKNHLST